MDVDLSALSDDVVALHQLIGALAAERANERAALAEAQAEIDRLRQIVRQLQRSQFGQRAERWAEDQLRLVFEDLDADFVAVAAPVPAPTRPSTRSVRASLPAHLPREDVLVDIDTHVCACGGALHAIGESVSEMLDHVPARLRVLRIRRPKYGCRACGAIHQAPAPERPIAKGLATSGLLAHVLVSKYCDHIPLYRQSQIFARQGVALERATLANWVAAAAWWLKPLREKITAHVLAAHNVFADDTPVPVLDPGRGRTKTGRLWVYARDDRSWSGPDPPAVAYVYSPDRRAERPAAHLGRFSGVLQVDGYAGFERIARRGDVMLAACWAHYPERSFIRSVPSPSGASLRRMHVCGL